MPSQQYSPPVRPSRLRDPVSGAPSELVVTLRIPRTREGILAALEVEQSAYELAKGVVSTLEEDKLDRVEEREHEKSAILQTIAANAYPSMAARERAEKDALAASEALRHIDRDETGIRRALIRANEDVSVFRHRMLTLRSALDTSEPEPQVNYLGPEGGR